MAGDEQQLQLVPRPHAAAGWHMASPTGNVAAGCSALGALALPGWSSDPCWASLPLDVFLTVISKLAAAPAPAGEPVPRHAAAPLRLVCRVWRDYHDCALDVLEPSPDITDALLAPLLRRFAGSLRTLNLCRCTRISAAGLSSLATATRLESVLLGGCMQLRDGELTPLLPCLTGVTRLDISSCDALSDEGLAALRFLAALRVLDLSWNERFTGSAFTASQPPARLEIINLQWCDQLQDVGLQGLSGLQGLLTLNLSWNLEISDAGLAALGSLSGLRELHLTGCKRLTDQALVSVANMRGLTALSLSECMWFTDEGLRHVSSLRALRSLALFRCWRVTGAGLAPLRALPLLATLNVSWCLELSDACIRQLRGCRALRSLDVSDCFRLGDGAVEALKELPQLQSLDLSHTHVSDGALQHLPAFSALHALRTVGCPGLSTVGRQLLRMYCLLRRIELDQPPSS